MTARCTVSPGTRLDAATVVPSAECWVRPMLTTPVETDWAGGGGGGEPTEGAQTGDRRPHQRPGPPRRRPSWWWSRRACCEPWEFPSRGPALACDGFAVDKEDSAAPGSRHPRATPEVSSRKPQGRGPGSSRQLSIRMLARHSAAAVDLLGQLLQCGERDVLRHRPVRRPSDTVGLLPVPRGGAGDADGGEALRSERLDEGLDGPLVEDRRARTRPALRRRGRPGRARRRPARTRPGHGRGPGGRRRCGR